MRLRHVWIVPALVLAGLVAAPSAAWAGGGVVASNPVNGAALGTAPSDVDLTFSLTPDASASHVSTRDDAGREVGSDEVTRSGIDELRLPVHITAPGVYTVAYHVRFTDGTDVIGVLRFSVGTGIAPPVVNAAEQREAEALVLAGHNHDVDPLSASIMVVDAVVLIGVILLLMRRPAPRRFLDESD